MKKVPCSNPTCNQRRKHHETPDENRDTLMCEVPDDHVGVVFCSITCACMAGYYNVRYGWVKDPRDGSPIERPESKDQGLAKLSQMTQEFGGYDAEVGEGRLKVGETSSPRTVRLNQAIERANNVFVDLGFSNAEEVTIKADAMAAVQKAFADVPEMSEGDIASLLDIPAAAVRDLLACKMSRFSLGELESFRAVLDRYAEEFRVKRTSLSPEGARRFIEIIGQEESFSDNLRERLKRGIEESAVGQTTVLNLDDLAKDE